MATRQPTAIPLTPRDPEMVIRALLMFDLVDSTRLVAELGDAPSAELFARFDRTTRDLLKEHGGREIDKSDGFLALFERPVEAVLCALCAHDALEALSRDAGVRLAMRCAIHLGEVHLRENAPEDVKEGAKPLEVEGLAKPTVARLMALALPRQTLLTRTAFDLSRRALVGQKLPAGITRWLAHGPYMFKGVDEPVEVYEVGREGQSPLCPPPDSPKAQRAIAAGDEVTLGWRPAPGQDMPHRENWILQEKLGEGGFGEVWLAEHRKTREKRVFKFCFHADRLRGLKREVVLFRLLKEALGDRSDIARILDWQFEEAPYFIEGEYTKGGNLADWANSKGGITKVPLEQRIDIVAQVAEALAAAHSVGVLHKDIKPSNILISEDSAGRPRATLTDFGVGLVTDRHILDERGITASGLTESIVAGPDSSRTGTRLYMAPEILEGKPATTRSDIFALGILLYQVVSGDLLRALAPGWERDISNDFLRDDVADCVEGNQARRMDNAQQLADRLRSIEERRQDKMEQERLRREAAMARASMERAAARRQVRLVVFTVVSLFIIMMSGLGILVDIGRRQAVKARHELEASSARADELLKFMLFDLRDNLQRIGQTALLEGVARKSLEYYESLPESGITMEQLQNRAVALENIGLVMMRQGRLGEALASYEKALEIRERVRRETPQPNRRSLAMTEACIAEALAGLGRQKESEAAYLRALADADPVTCARIHVRRGRLRAVSEPDEARQDYESALKVLEGVGPKPEEAGALQVHVEALLLLNRPDDAQPIMDELTRRGKVPPELGALARTAGLRPVTLVPERVGS